MNSNSYHYSTAVARQATALSPKKALENLHKIAHNLADVTELKAAQLCCTKEFTTVGELAHTSPHFWKAMCSFPLPFQRKLVHVLELEPPGPLGEDSDSDEEPVKIVPSLPVANFEQGDDRAALLSMATELAGKPQQQQQRVPKRNPNFNTDGLAEAVAVHLHQQRLKQQEHQRQLALLAAPPPPVLSKLSDAERAQLKTAGAKRKPAAAAAPAMAPRPAAAKRPAVAAEPAKAKRQPPSQGTILERIAAQAQANGLAWAQLMAGDPDDPVKDAKAKEHNRLRAEKSAKINTQRRLLAQTSWKRSHVVDIILDTPEYYEMYLQRLAKAERKCGYPLVKLPPCVIVDDVSKADYYGNVRLVHKLKLLETVGLDAVHKANLEQIQHTHKFSFLPAYQEAKANADHDHKVNLKHGGWTTSLISKIKMMELNFTFGEDTAPESFHKAKRARAEKAEGRKEKRRAARGSDDESYDSEPDEPQPEPQPWERRQTDAYLSLAATNQQPAWLLHPRQLHEHQPMDFTRAATDLQHPPAAAPAADALDARGILAHMEASLTNGAQLRHQFQQTQQTHAFPMLSQMPAPPQFQLPPLPPQRELPGTAEYPDELQQQLDLLPPPLPPATPATPDEPSDSEDEMDKMLNAEKARRA